MLPKKDQEALSLVKSCTVLCLVTTGLFALILAYFGGFIVNWVHAYELKHWLPWVILCVLSSGLYQILNYWVTRKRLFKPISISRVLHSVVSIPIQLVGGFAHVGPVALLAGYTAGWSIQLASLWTLTRKTFPKRLSTDRARPATKILSEHKGFPLLMLPASILAVLETHTVYFIFSRLFGIENLGQFSMVMNSFLLLNLLSQAVSSSLLSAQRSLYPKPTDLQATRQGCNVAYHRHAASGDSDGNVWGFTAPPSSGFRMETSWTFEPSPNRFLFLEVHTWVHQHLHRQRKVFLFSSLSRRWFGTIRKSSVRILLPI